MALMTKWKKQMGSTSVEFALAGLTLMFATFAIFESCYQIYVVNMTEFALRETIRNTKVDQGIDDTPEKLNEHYETYFRQLIMDNNKIWHFLMDGDKFTIEGTYYQSYDDFVAGVGHTSQGVGFYYDLAEITVEYEYEPMIELVSSDTVKISRTMVLNLEHQGWGGDE